MLTLANPGAAVLFQIGIHLVLLNSMIGLTEGLILTFGFKAKWWRAIPLMIAANYFSAWMFFFVVEPLRQLIEPMLGESLFEAAWPTLWVILAISLFATFALESPWVWFVFKKDRRSFSRLARSLVAVHLVTYPALAW